MHSGNAWMCWSRESKMPTESRPLATTWPFLPLGRSPMWWLHPNAPNRTSPLLASISAESILLARRRPGTSRNLRATNLCVKHDKSAWYSAEIKTHSTRSFPSLVHWRLSSCATSFKNYSPAYPWTKPSSRLIKVLPPASCTVVLFSMS